MHKRLKLEKQEKKNHSITLYTIEVEMVTMIYSFIEALAIGYIHTKPTIGVDIHHSHVVIVLVKVMRKTLGSDHSDQAKTSISCHRKGCPGRTEQRCRETPGQRQGRPCPGSRHRQSRRGWHHRASGWWTCRPLSSSVSTNTAKRGHGETNQAGRRRRHGHRRPRQSRRPCRG